MNSLDADVVGSGLKNRVDYRVFDFTATSSNYSVVIPLDADEFPVRAVIRTFDKANNIGTFKPITSLSYNRLTRTLSVSVGNDREGKLYVEFWGPA